MNRSSIPMKLKPAIDLGWKPTRPKRLQVYSCAAGCGRSYTGAGDDEVHNGLRMVGYLCIDCRKSMAGFLRAQKLNSHGKSRASATRAGESSSGTNNGPNGVKITGAKT